jgi:hypothetical protein
MQNRSKAIAWACWALLNVLLWPPASADPTSPSAVRHVAVEHAKGVFRVFADTVVAAPLEDVESLLLDFEAASRLNPSIRQSTILGQVQGGGTRVRMRVRVCEFFVCRNVIRTEVVTREMPGLLRGVIEPEGTDFKWGTTEWRLSDRASGTRLIYTGSFEPDFWVPPLIGPPMIAHRLRDELRVLVENLEVLAQARAAARSCKRDDGPC